jgi:hypothetical protein
VNIVLPLPVHDKPVLVSSGQEPNLNFPDSCFILPETEVTRTPVVEIPDHEHVFGLRGVAGQFDLYSPATFFDLCLTMMPVGQGHRRGRTAIVDPFHIYSFHILSSCSKTFRTDLQRAPLSQARQGAANYSQNDR